jgi:hypothetical protein
MEIHFYITKEREYYAISSYEVYICILQLRVWSYKLYRLSRCRLSCVLFMNTSNGLFLVLSYSQSGILSLLPYNLIL